MTGATMLFLAAQTILFFVASLLHRGVFVSGYEHAHASTAATVIGAVLLLGLLASLLRTDAARRMIVLLLAGLWVTRRAGVI